MSSVPSRAFFVCLLALACLSTARASDRPAAVEASAVDAQTSVAARLTEAEALLAAWPERTTALEEVDAIVDAVLAQDPQAWDAYRVRAMVWLRRDEREDAMRLAEEALGRAISGDPRNDRAYVLRAQLYAQTRRWAESQRDLVSAESLAPDNPWMHLNWSDVLFARDEDAQALARCEKAARLARKDLWVQSNALSCRIRYHRRAGALDKAERLHREQIALDPARAWPHGNYAAFLVCREGRQDDAIRAARDALSIMRYGNAELILATGLYRRWAARLAAGDMDGAQAAWIEARAEATVDPAALLEYQCGGAPLFEVLTALHATGRANVYTAKDAVVLATEAHRQREQGLPGVFRMTVAATGRGRGNEAGRIYLNSEPNYRDPRCLTITFTPAAAKAFAAAHGSAPDEVLEGREITVIGVARRIQILVPPQNQPAPSHYYQTHVVVHRLDQLVPEETEASPDRSGTTASATASH